MELAECFLLYPYGNWGIWLKFWYFVLFFFLILTLRLLFFLSLSASTDASWPIGSVNPFQPALGWLCQCSILLGFAVNPHGSLPHDIYTANLPLSQFPHPGFFHCTKLHQKKSGTKHKPGRKAVPKAVRCFPLCHGTAKIILWIGKLMFKEMKYSWKIWSQNSNPGLLTMEPMLNSPHQKMFSLSFQ